MRKITTEACDAFENDQNFKSSNTEVKDGRMFLFGNLIAEFEDNIKGNGNNNINITLAGWNSNTTRERLNGLRGVSVNTKQGQAYLNGKPWDGEWITIVR